MQMAAIDFDMADALGDLIRVGLVREIGTGEVLEVVPVQDAIAIMSIRNYPEEAAEEPVAKMVRSSGSWSNVPGMVVDQSASRIGTEGHRDGSLGGPMAVWFVLEHLVHVLLRLWCSGGRDSRARLLCLATLEMRY